MPYAHVTFFAMVCKLYAHVIPIGAQRREESKMLSLLD